MTEDYDSKKKRLSRLRDSLQPASLRSQVPFRHIEAVVALPDEKRRLLAECLQRAGKINFRKALGLLENPEGLSAESLAGKARVAKPTAGRPDLETIPANPGSRLPEVIRRCFPGMPEVSVAGVAGSEPMREAAMLSESLHSAISGSHSRSDFVIVVLYALLTEALDELEHKIRAVPAFTRAVKNAGLTWEEN